MQPTLGHMLSLVLKSWKMRQYYNLCLCGHKVCLKDTQESNNSSYLVGSEMDGNCADGEQKCQGDFSLYSFTFYFESHECIIFSKIQ